MISYQEIKHKRLIHAQMSIDAEVHLGVVRDLIGSQKVEVLEVSL